MHNVAWNMLKIGKQLQKFCRATTSPNILPSAFIFLPGQLVPPGKQQSEGSELLGVKRLFLLPLQLQVGLLCVYRLYISLCGR